MLAPLIVKCDFCGEEDIAEEMLVVEDLVLCSQCGNENFWGIITCPICGGNYCCHIDDWYGFPEPCRSCQDIQTLAEHCEEDGLNDIPF